MTLKSSFLDTCHFRLSIFHCLNIKEALFFSKIWSVLKILVYICVFWAVIVIVRVNLHSSSIVAKTNIIFERELRVVMCPNLQSQHLWMLHRRLLIFYLHLYHQGSIKKYLKLLINAADFRFEYSSGGNWTLLNSIVWKYLYLIKLLIRCDIGLYLQYIKWYMDYTLKSVLIDHPRLVLIFYTFIRKYSTA